MCILSHDISLSNLILGTGIQLIQILQTLLINLHQII